ncbi:hypothetical protein BDV59DRAFT_187195 [Aspergillus ambiguus]|uniref:uncharacterized protein n=1 Tax=Aspergillus ambiguus TaxID=176160 RepID=UPI003CCDBDF3
MELVEPYRSGAWKCCYMALGNPLIANVVLKKGLLYHIRQLFRRHNKQEVCSSHLLLPFSRRCYLQVKHRGWAMVGFTRLVNAILIAAMLAQ